MKKHVYPVIFLLIVASGFVFYETCAASLDSSVIPLDKNTGKILLHRHLDILEDPGGTLTIEDVSSNYAEHFSPTKHFGNPSFGYTDSAYWARFEVKNNSGAQHWFVEVSYPVLNLVEAYLPDKNGKYRVVKTGNKLPFNSRELYHRNFIFNFPIAPGDQKTAYMRIKTQSTMVLPLTIWGNENLYKKTIAEYSFLGIYFGILVIMGIYNFFIFVYIKSRNNLFYAFYILNVGLFILTFNGLSYQFFWPDYPGWGNTAITVFIFSSGFAALLFARNFLDTKTHAPFLDKILRVYMAVCLAMLPVCFFADFTIVMKTAICLSTSGIVILILSSIVSLKNGHRSAGYFLVAWSFMATGIFLISMRSLGIVADNFFTLYGLQFMSGMEITILSLGIADQMRTWKNETATDELTSLFNRRYLIEHASNEVRAAREKGKTLSIIIFDIDHFKDVNDLYGHLAGDRVLKQFAGVLQETIRKPDIISRFGGEEFLTLLPHTDIYQAAKTAERLRTVIESHFFEIKENLSIRISASFGVSSFKSGDGNLEDIIRRADRALNAAKAAGKNRVLVEH